MPRKEYSFRIEHRSTMIYWLQFGYRADLPDTLLHSSTHKLAKASYLQYAKLPTTTTMSPATSASVLSPVRSEQTCSGTEISSQHSTQSNTAKYAVA